MTPPPGKGWVVSFLIPVLYLDQIYRNDVLHVDSKATVVKNPKMVINWSLSSKHP